MTEHRNYPGDEPYGDYPTGPIGGESSDQPKGKSPARVSIPTVLASAGVAAVVSALIMSIGLVGVLLSNAQSTNASEQPTVVNLGAAAQEQQAQAPAAAPGSPASTKPSTSTRPATENVPESDGGGDTSGDSNNAGATNGAANSGNANGQNTDDGAQQPQEQQDEAASPQALTPGQLNTKVNLIMNSGADRAARANELEGGERALSQIDAVSAAIAAFGNVGFSYRMIEPVSVNGQTMTGTLEMTVVGRGSQNQDLTWTWSGDMWKLTNQSTCDIAALVLLPCSL